MKKQKIDELLKLSHSNAQGVHITEFRTLFSFDKTTKVQCLQQPQIKKFHAIKKYMKAIEDGLSDQILLWSRSHTFKLVSKADARLAV